MCAFVYLFIYFVSCGVVIDASKAGTVTVYGRVAAVAQSGAKWLTNLATRIDRISILLYVCVSVFDFSIMSNHCLICQNGIGLSMDARFYKFSFTDPKSYTTELGQIQFSAEFGIAKKKLCSRNATRGVT